MHTTDETMKLLLISDGSDKAAMLRQLMEQQGLRGEICRMHQGRSAIACARHNGPYKGERTPDIVLLDFSAPDKRSLSVLKQVALSGAKASAPVIILTSSDSETLLRSGDLEFDESRVFAPTSLMCFVRKMRLHSRQRFLRALSVMGDLGPILVRLPASIVGSGEDAAALIA